MAPFVRFDRVALKKKRKKKKKKVTVSRCNKGTDIDREESQGKENRVASDHERERID